MSALIDVHSLLRVAGIALVSSVGVVLLFSLAVASMDLADGDRPGGDASRAARVLGRSGAAVALALCVAALVVGLALMLKR
jgi:hypothetical protein